MFLHYVRRHSKYLTVLEGRYLAWLVHTYLEVKTARSYVHHSDQSFYRRFPFQSPSRITRRLYIRTIVSSTTPGSI
jgi:hypothetical protein